MERLETGEYVSSSVHAIEVPRILILVLSFDAEPWRSIEEAQRSTWVLRCSREEVLYVRGRTGGAIRSLYFALRSILIHANAAFLLPRLDVLTGRILVRFGAARSGDILLTQVPETRTMTSAKTIAAFRNVIKTCHFDYLVRTNSSSYVNIAALRDFLMVAPRVGFFGGSMVQNKGDVYPGGTGIILSRDVVETIVADPGLEYDFVDDRAIGRSARRAGLIPQSLPWLTLSAEEEASRLDHDAVRRAFLIRCKSATASREHDVWALRFVDNILTSGGS